MASNTETATSKVIIDGTEAEDELKRLTKLSSELKKQLRLAVQHGDDEGAKKLKKELSAVEKEASAAKRELNSISAVMKNLNGSSLKQLQGAQRQLTAEIRSSTRNTREEIEVIEEKKKQLRMLKAEIDKVQSSMALQKGGFMGQIANGFNKYFTMATTFIMAITGVVVSLKSLIFGNSELSDSFADVAKTTGLTIAEVKELYKELGKIDTRTKRKELLDLAYAAGKLGYTGKAEILGFVKAADQIGVALSKDLGDNVEDAVTSLGKLVDIFKIKDKFGIEQALLKTGSAINALGASGTATESYIVEFTKRLGGIAPQAGISIEKVMGLGATLDQLGQQVETSSTAVGQLMTKMFQKPGEYAKIAGMNVADFTKLLKTDANAALIKLLEGLNKNKGGLTELASKFGDLGVDGSRAISVIGALSNNVEMLKDAQHLSNVEFAKGTSLTKEFNLKNDNMAGNLERVGKALKAAFVNSTIMSGLEKLVKWMASWGEIPLADKLEQERIKVNILAAQLMEANVQATTRNKLYGELNALAPGVTEGINKEAIAYNQLRINLEKYNKQMINQIVLKRKDAEIQAMAEDAGDWVSKRSKKEQEIRDYMTRSADFVAKRNKEAGDQLKFIVNNELLTFQQKYDLFWKSIDQLQKTNKGSSQIVALDKDKISTTYTMYLGYLDKEKKAIGEVNDVTNSRNELAKSLGVTLDIITTKTEENAGSTNMSSNSTQENTGIVEDNTEATEALGDAFKVLQEKISKFDSQINEAIGKGNTPLAQKLQLEKKAAQDLLLVYEALKKEIEKGWDVDQRDLGPIQQLVTRTATNVVSKEKVKSPLAKRDTGLSPASQEEAAQAERDRVAAEETAAADQRQAIQDAAFSGATSLNNGIFEITRNRQQAELDHKLSMLDKQRAAELSNKKLTEAEKDAINAKYDAKTRKLKQDAFKKQQNADKIQSLINGAIAITKTFAAYGFTPAGWAAAAAQAIETGIEYAVIADQEVPEFAKGRYNVTGANTGKEYSNISYTGPAVTGLYTKPAIVAESGAEMIIDAPTTRNLMVNYPEIIEAINNARIPEFAFGRYVENRREPVKEQNQSNTADPALLAIIKENTEVMKQMRQQIENGISTKFSLFDFEKIQKEKATIEDATTF